MPEITKEQLDTAIEDTVIATTAALTKEFEGKITDSVQKALVEQAKQDHPFVGGTFVPSAAKEQEKSAPILGKIGLALIRSKGIPKLALDYAEDRLQADKTETNDRVVKALNISNFADGGLLIGDEILPEIQPHLRANSVIRRMTKWVLPMVKGGIKINRSTGDPTASWVDENTPVAPTDPTFDQLVMKAHTLKAKTIISNDLIAADDYGVESYVTNALAESIGLAEDLAAIRGDGGENSPVGIKNQIASGNDFATAGTTLANIMTDMGTAMAKFGVANVNANPDAVGVFMNPGTLAQLWIKADTTGVTFPFREEILAGKFFGWKLDTTTQIPLNLGGGSDESEIYVVDFSKFIIGETKKLILSFDNSGVYENPVGTALSLQDRDQSCIRATEQVDFGLVKNVAACRISGVKYFLS